MAAHEDPRVRLRLVDRGYDLDARKVLSVPCACRDPNCPRGARLPDHDVIAEDDRGRNRGRRRVYRYRGGKVTRAFRGTWQTKDGRFTVKYLSHKPGMWFKWQREGGVEVTDHSVTPYRVHLRFTLKEARQLMAELYDQAGVTRESVRGVPGRKMGPRAVCKSRGCGQEHAAQVKHCRGNWGHECRRCGRRWTVAEGQCARSKHGIKADRTESKGKGGRR